MPDTLTKNVRTVRTSVQERAAESEMKVAGDFYGELEARTTRLLDEAILRAKQNGRKTLLIQDV